MIAQTISRGFNNKNFKNIIEGIEKNKFIIIQMSIKILEQKSECFVKKYGMVKETITIKNINSLLTLNENIADNGGLKIAHKDYMKYPKISVNIKNSTIKSMKYCIAIIVAVIALRCYGNNHYKMNNPLYMSLTRTQIQQIRWIEDDDTISQTQIKQKISDYLNTQGGNLANLYNQYVQNQTSLLNEVKQARIDLINNSTMSESAKNAQKQIDQISSNENLSRNDKKKLRGWSYESNEQMSSGPLVGKVNNGLRNYDRSGERIFDFDFDDIYEIAKRSINTPALRGRRYI
uniref:Peptidase_M13 domain-containing protein n=1 Tax=Strongyloides venezuelensis TaxID=75913 RepID=A0A0K0FP25_STRVS